MTMPRSFGFLAAALVAACGATALCCHDAQARGLTDDASHPAVSDAPPSPLQVLRDARPWLAGSVPALRGKVVVVNVWTYSCINSLRALPYLRAWNAHYGAKGLAVIGVHAPEFGFEHDPARVRTAMGALGITYPNVLDNDYTIWRAFGNEGWPGFYVIDANGRLRGHTVGEGSYAGMEQLIRTLLAEAGQDLSGVPLAPVAGDGVQAQADWSHLQSPEAYLGYAKARDFASPGGIARNRARAYAPGSVLLPNQWDLGGNWTVTPEFIRLTAAGGAIGYRFHARDAHIVLGAPVDGKPVRFRVTIDGAAPGASHGSDTDAQGWGELREDRLYQLFRQQGDVADHIIRIAFDRPGVRAYSFTFG